MGVGLYGLTYVYPIYLSRVRGYSSLQIGETMFVSGLCMFVAAPIVGRLMGKVDPRILIGIGFAGFAVGTWQASYVTKDWDFWELLVPQMLRGFSLMTAMVPINNVALGTLPPARLKNASGLYNLTRNLGGAVGLACINTLINDRWDLHLARLHESVAWGHEQAERTLQALTGAYASMGSDAALSATKRLAMIVRQQALVMSLSDVFLALTCLFLALVAVTPLMSRPGAGWRRGRRALSIRGRRGFGCRGKGLGGLGQRRVAGPHHGAGFVDQPGEVGSVDEPVHGKPAGPEGRRLVVRCRQTLVERGSVQRAVRILSRREQPIAWHMVRPPTLFSTLQSGRRPLGPPFRARRGSERCSRPGSSRCVSTRMLSHSCQHEGGKPPLNCDVPFCVNASAGRKVGRTGPILRVPASRCAGR